MSRTLNNLTFLQIFASVFPESYAPPTGFNFEINYGSPIVQVNP